MKSVILITALYIIDATAGSVVELTPDQEARYHCFSESMKQFHEYKKTQGEEKIKNKAAKAGYDWLAYQNMLVSALAKICYEKELEK